MARRCAPKAHVFLGVPASFAAALNPTKQSYFRREARTMLRAGKKKDLMYQTYADSPGPEHVRANVPRGTFAHSPIGRRPRVVIIGAGFAGLNAAKALAKL